MVATPPAVSFSFTRFPRMFTSVSLWSVVRSPSLTLQDVNVHVAPRLVLLRALVAQDGQLARLGPALEVLDGAGVGGKHFQHLAPAHAVDLLLGLHDRHWTLRSANVELSGLHDSPRVRPSAPRRRRGQPRPRTRSCPAPTRSPCRHRSRAGPGWRGRSRHSRSAAT